MSDMGNDALDDEQRGKLRAKALRRISGYIDEWRELQSTSPQGMHTPIAVRDVDRYNDALNRLRRAGETVPGRYYVAGPVIPKGTYVGQPHDGVPVHALLGKARTVLLLIDRSAASPDQA